MKDIKPYRPTDPEWQKLKAEYRKGDYFVQFWRGRALVERTKFYMDGLYLVRQGCRLVKGGGKLRHNPSLQPTASGRG